MRWYFVERERDNPLRLCLSTPWLGAIACLCISAAASFGQRPAWTTSRVQGAPTPPLPYVTQRVFGDITFDHPVTFTSAPGTGSMFLLEQHGKIYELTSEQSAEATLIVDLARTVPGFQDAYGLEFHPDFPQNRNVYICYICRDEEENGTRLSRFRFTRSSPMQLEPDSEQILLTWQKGGHNGGCVKFGPDGYLYVSTGDAAAPFPPDPDKVGQDVSNLLSTILRIDVDHADGERAYSIPADNPFVNLESARSEIYAYGFRNPWRMAFDRETGDLWAGDVGWELWEMIYDVQSGGNYGWAIVEGPKSLHPNDTPGPTPILKPAASHSHAEARSITGGQVYYGERLPELRGAYIYGDHVTGKMWMLRKQAGEISGPVEIARAPLQIICFGLHQNGEVYIVDYAGGIYRLIRREENSINERFPTALSQSGLFANTLEHQVSPGVLAYTINAEPWMDGATAERFVAIPGDQQIGVYRQGGGHADWDGKHPGSWKFPKNSVLGKTLSLDGRRVETQLLHYDGQAWQAYSYLWNEQQSDAELAEDRTHTVQLTVNGQKRHWLISSRSDCMVCHSNASDMLLGFKPEQLRRRTELVSDQLAHFESLGVFTEPPAARRTVTNPWDATKSLEERSRAYLHVNCAHCHRRNGGGAVPMHVVYDAPMSATRLVGELPTQGNFGIEDAYVIAPGMPQRSVLLYRFCKAGVGHMPKLGGLELDHRGAKLLYDWIASIQPRGLAEQQTALRETLVATAEESALVEQLSSIETSMLAGHLLRSESVALPVRERVLAAAAKLPSATRELFESFIPIEQRTVRLGTEIDIDQIFAATGDPSRGRELFLSANLTCKNCHSTEAGVISVGPNLATLQQHRYEAMRLLNSILHPSEEIEDTYRSHVVQTVDGQVLTGIVKEIAGGITLRDAQNKVHTLAREDIEFRQASKVSLMPEQLLADLTLEQAADMLAYLASLRENR